MKPRRSLLFWSLAPLLLLALLAVAGRSAGRLLGDTALALRATLVATSITTVTALAVGLVLGIVGGSGPRLLDAVLRFGVEISGAFPTVFAALVLLSVAPGWVSGLFSLGVLRGLELAWLLRSELIRIESAERNVVTRNLGHTPLASFFRNRLPRSIGPALVAASFTCSWLLAIDSAASLAKLGPHSLSTLGALVVNASSIPEALLAILVSISISAALYVLGRAFMPQQFQAQDRPFRAGR